MSADKLRAIKNYHRISGDLATAGQPTPGQLADIAEAGYEALINIDSATAVPNEDALVTSKGLGYFHIPVVWTEPKQSDLHLFFDLMDALKGKRVFVHCAANARVSTFVYLYRISRLGVDPVEGEKDLHELWEPNEIWSTFIDEAAGRLGLELSRRNRGREDR